MRWIAGVLLTTMVCGCGAQMERASAPAPSPETEARTVLERYRTAVAAGDAAAVCRTLSEGAQREVVSVDNKACVTAVRENLRGWPEPIRTVAPRITAVKVHGNRAEVHVDRDVAGMKSTPAKLVREADGWKVWQPSVAGGSGGTQEYFDCVVEAQHELAGDPTFEAVGAAVVDEFSRRVCARLQAKGEWTGELAETYAKEILLDLYNEGKLDPPEDERTV
ncbi:hypothetical protein DVA67_024595 [Solirubrobacter sp. CPCC 204708]|uniref:Lipoprotein n=1 Tax=Solirubrobacter deserti TaxID=2282478 RepID=A0ABT4RUF5_9ACTN|nr:hypothetical protein [Solirubrobacter deserti]MBE2319178.1 hypothetical protein [Solirubrobacter deserti]MDA0142204.1 hypothetical protein [Solirubrobacter deserti]